MIEGYRAAMRTPHLLLAAIAPLLAGCGSNLTILHQRWPVQGPDDETVVLLIDNQPQLGIGSYGPPVVVAAMGILMEPMDWICSTIAFVSAPFSEGHSIAGGPFGYVAALTPFATLVPAMTRGPGPVHADAAMLARLRSDSADERRAAAQELVGPQVDVRDARLVSPR